MFIKMKKREMVRIADKVHEFQVMKRGLRAIEGYSYLVKERKEMIERAIAVGDGSLKRRALQTLKAHSLIQRERKERNR